MRKKAISNIGDYAGLLEIVRDISRKMRALFDMLPWYKPSISDPSVVEKQFNAYEIANIKNIVAEERSLKCLGMPSKPTYNEFVNALRGNEALLIFFTAFSRDHAKLIEDWTRPFSRTEALKLYKSNINDHDYAECEKVREAIYDAPDNEIFFSVIAYKQTQYCVLLGAETRRIIALYEIGKLLSGSLIVPNPSNYYKARF